MYRYVNTVYNTYIHIYLYIDRYVCVCVCIFATIATKLRHIKSALSHLCSFYLKSNILSISLHRSHFYDKQLKARDLCACEN